MIGGSYRIPDLILVLIDAVGHYMDVLLIVEDKLYTNPMKQLYSYLRMFPRRSFPNTLALGYRVNKLEGGLEFCFIRLRDREELSPMYEVVTDTPDTSTYGWYSYDNAFIYRTLQGILDKHGSPAKYFTLADAARILR